MIAALAALALVVAVGVPLAALLDRRATVDEVLGEGVLIGIGATTMILLGLSVAHVPWSRTSVVVTCVVVAAIAWGFVWRAHRTFGAERPMKAPLASLFDAATVIALGGFTLLATITHLWEFDFIGNWGLKARVFFQSRGIDWSFLEDLLERASHPDYPPLLPLSFDLFAIMGDAWDDRWIGLVNVAFAAGSLLVVRRMFFREVASRAAAAFGTFVMLPLVAAPWIGIADGPLAAVVLCALLLFRRAIADDDSGAFAAGAVLLGIAAFTKNEGLTFIVAAALGLAAAGKWRLIPRLWPAVVIPLPWLVLRSMHSLPTDLAEGNVFSRIVDHLLHPQPLLVALTKYAVGKPLFWVALVVGVALTLRTIVRTERLVLVTVAVQFGFYIAAYLSTPHGLDWHVRWSWDRLIAHVAAPLTFIVLAELLRRGTARTASE